MSSILGFLTRSFPTRRRSAGLKACATAEAHRPPEVAQGFSLACGATLALLVAPQLSIAATVHGLVSDPDRRPIPGARLVLIGPLGAAAEARTGADGRFRIDNIDSGRYELHVLTEGFRSAPIALRLDPDETREVAVELQLSALSESVVVSAAQIDLPLSRTPGSVTVIGEAEIRSRQIETVGDALRWVPGLASARNGGRGTVTSLFSRGGESDFTLVLVDGVRVNAFGGFFNFAHLPAADVERIEIVRGPQSALFGADAIGAVVSVIRRHGGPPRADAMVEAGSLGTTGFAASFSGSSGAGGRWTWGGGVERQESEGFTGAAPATGERVANDDSLRRHVAGSLGWQGAKGADVRVDAGLATSERGSPGPFGANPIGAITAIDRISRGRTHDRRIGLRVNRPWSSPRGPVRVRAQISYADFDGDFTSRFGASESESRRLAARAQADVGLLAAAGLSVGVELQREHGGSTFITGLAAQPIPVKRRVIGYFGEGRLEAAERLFLNAGVRLEQIRRDPLEPGFGRPAFAAESLLSANPKLAVSYFVRRASASAPGSWTRLHGSAGTGIRPPDAFEIAFTDNPDLKPERSRSLDVGVEQALAGGRLILEATGFFNRYDELIVAIGRSLRDASRFRTDNISNARSRGLEIAAATRAPWGLDVRVGYTFLDTDILAVDGAAGQAPPPFKVGDPLIRRPRHQGSIDVAFAAGRLATFAQLGSRGETLDVEPAGGASGGLFRAPGYGVVHAGASVRLAARLELYARVNNLLDRQYEETLGFPALGRTAMVGARTRIAARR